MPDYNFDGHALVMGNTVAGLVGLWTSEVYLADSDAVLSVGQQGTLTILGTSRVGTVVAAGSEAGYCRARIVGGANKMSAVLEPRDYQGYTAGAIVADCLTDAGEVVGDGWRQFDISCSHWTRLQGPCRDAMRRLCRLSTGDAHWRVAADGSIAYYIESWPTNDAVDRDTFIWPQESLVQFYPADGSVAPGQTVHSFGAARRIERVEYRWSPEEVTCRGWYQ